MAASGEQAPHFQPSTDEMAQLEEKHVEAVRYECTCYIPKWRHERLPFCLPSEIRVSGTETNMSRLLHKQTGPVNTQFHPSTIVHRNPIHPAFRVRPVFMNFKEFRHGVAQNLVPDFPVS